MVTRRRKNHLQGAPKVVAKFIGVRERDRLEPFAHDVTDIRLRQPEILGHRSLCHAAKLNRFGHAVVVSRETDQVLNVCLSEHMGETIVGHAENVKRV